MPVLPSDTPYQLARVFRFGKVCAAAAISQFSDSEGATSIAWDLSVGSNVQSECQDIRLIFKLANPGTWAIADGKAMTFDTGSKPEHAVLNKYLNIGLVPHLH